MNIVSAPKAIMRRMRVRTQVAGVFDGLVGASFAGWCTDGTETPVEVRLFLGTHVLLDMPAGLARADVGQARGISPYCGFAFPIRRVERALDAIVASASAAPGMLRVVGPGGFILPGFNGMVDPLAFKGVAAVAFAAHLFSVDFHAVGKSSEIY